MLLEEEDRSVDEANGAETLPSKQDGANGKRVSTQKPLEQTEAVMKGLSEATESLEETDKGKSGKKLFGLLSTSNMSL